MRIGYECINTPVALFGIVTNILIIVVMRQKCFRCRPYTYMQWIAFVDLIICSLTAPVGFLRCEKHNPMAQFFIGVYMWFICYPLSKAAAACSVWTTMALTVDRLLAIKYPFRKNTWHAKYVALVFAICALALYSPYFFTLYYNQRRLRFRQTSFRRSPE